jgi:hypothetical protein
MVYQKIFYKVMDSMLNLNFTEKEGLVETASVIYSDIQKNINKFDKRQIWLLSSRCSRFRDMILKYGKNVI